LASRKPKRRSGHPKMQYRGHLPDNSRRKRVIDFHWGHNQRAHFVIMSAVLALALAAIAAPMQIDQGEIPSAWCPCSAQLSQRTPLYMLPQEAISPTCSHLVCVRACVRSDQGTLPIAIFDGSSKLSWKTGSFSPRPARRVPVQSSSPPPPPPSPHDDVTRIHNLASEI
jgi:hypothetical protein